MHANTSNASSNSSMASMTSSLNYSEILSKQPNPEPKQRLISIADQRRSPLEPHAKAWRVRIYDVLNSENIKENATIP